MIRPPLLYLGFILIHFALASLAKAVALTPGTGISLWAPNGFVLGILLLTPSRLWWRWLCLSAIAELLSNAVLFHNTWLLALAIASANTVEITCGAILLGRMKRSEFRLESPIDMLQLLTFGACASPILGAMLSGTALRIVDGLPWTKAFSLIWIGDATGVLLATPLVLIIAQHWASPQSLSRSQFLEMAAVLFVLVGLSIPILSGFLPNATIVLPPLLWISIRYTFLGAAVSLCAATAIAVSVVSQGLAGPLPPSLSLIAQPVAVQLFLSATAVSVLIVAAVSSEKMRMVRELQSLNSHLEKRVEERTRTLRESEAVFRTLGESSPDFLWMSESDGTPVYQNMAWREYTGLSQDDLARMGWECMIHKDDLVRLSELWQHARDNPAPFETEYRCRRRDGTYEWLLSRTAPILNESGKVIKWIGTGSNIQRMKFIEAELQQANTRKNEFLATLAHELRNPLAPARMAVGNLKLLAPSSAEVTHAVEVVDRQIATMARLIDDLMDVNRITQGKLVLKKRPEAISDILSAAIETARPRIEEMGHSLGVELPADEVFVDADSVRLTQVFLNLLNNAAKFTPYGGKIDVVACSTDGKLKVSVQDNGVGISPGQLANVFEMFAQIPGPSHMMNEGLGIGLCLVRSLVEMHGGAVSVASPGTGLGCTFVVTLPIHSGITRIGESSEDMTQHKSRPLSIVAVDDNVDAAQMLRMFLRLNGYAVEVAHDGASAIDLVRRVRPDLLICDIGLPEMDGYEVCRTLRADESLGQLVTCALTGWGNETDKEKAIEAGFNHHLTKPVDGKILLEFVRSLAGLPR